MKAVFAAWHWLSSEQGSAHVFTSASYRPEQLLNVRGGRVSRFMNSWKDIASYFGKSTRTVRRWEAKAGLPVRRPDGRNQRIVFAVPEEIARWAANRFGPRAAQGGGFVAVPVQVLNGWGEIADYLGKSSRTAQRWEKELHLPVHRPSGKRITLAVAKEIDDWINECGNG